MCLSVLRLFPFRISNALRLFADDNNIYESITLMLIRLHPHVHEHEQPLKQQLLTYSNVGNLSYSVYENPSFMFCLMKFQFPNRCHEDPGFILWARRLFLMRTPFTHSSALGCCISRLVSLPFLGIASHLSATQDKSTKWLLKGENTAFYEQCSIYHT